MYVLYEVRQWRRRAESCLHCSHFFTYSHKLSFTNWICKNSALCLAVCNVRIKTTTTINFCIFIFSVFQFGRQNFFQLSSGAHGPHECKGSLYAACGLSTPTILNLQIGLFCNVHNELYVSEAGNRQNAIYEVLNKAKNNVLQDAKQSVPQPARIGKTLLLYYLLCIYLRFLLG